MGESFQEKTEQPTDKRLLDARKKGQVAQSKELPSCFVILFTSLFLYFSLSQGFNELFKVYMTYVRNLNLEIDTESIFPILSFGVYRWLWIVLPVFGLLVLLTVFASVIQTGFLWSFEAVQFKFENVDPLSGLKKLVSKRAGIELLKSIVKISILAYVAYTLILKQLPEMLTLSDWSTRSIATYLAGNAFDLSLKVGVVFMFLAGLDYFIQRWQFRKEMMMTQQEVKEEYKDREGNPQVRSRIKSLQREMARRRMMVDVKGADVVVTNPTHFAIALKYVAGEMQAPRILAKGAGFVAEKIKEVARHHRIPLVENKPLAQALFYGARVGDYIPEKFYLIVAELLAKIYRRRQEVQL
jgi:flagellar biosynthesis protein FlhB